MLSAYAASNKEEYEKISRKYLYTGNGMDNIIRKVKEEQSK